MITKMSQNCAYRQKERASLEKYIRFFASKVVQAIVQSRTACTKKTRSKTSSTSHDWFNVAIDDEPSIREEINRALLHQRLLSDFSLCIEIQLKTAENAILVLETWCLYLKESFDPSIKLSSVYPRMCVLLKSIISVSRVCPAYKLAVHQSEESYIFQYKLYFGPPQVHILGEGYEDHKIGQVVTPVGVLGMSLAYRTKMTITPQKIMDKAHTTMMVSNYFKPDMSPKKVHPAAVNGFHTESNLNGSADDRRIAGAFAPSRTFPDPSLFPDLVLPDKPIINVPQNSSLMCSGEKRLQQDEPDKSPDKNANLCVATVDNKQSNTLSDEVDYNCNANSGNAAKILCSGSLECDDFVMVDLRPPFADSDGGNDVCAFFRECKCAPPLASFAAQPSLKEQVSDITNQLAKFETSMHDFDTFVDAICQGDIQK